MVEALEVVVAAGGTFGGHGAVRHTIAEIHPHVVAATLLARDPKSRRHNHKHTHHGTTRDGTNTQANDCATAKGHPQGEQEEQGDPENWKREQNE